MKKQESFLEILNNPDENKKSSEQEIYQMLFINDENQSVEAYETNSIVFEDLINHLKKGKSVFINRKKRMETKNY